MRRIILITGGQRSGKSSYAEKLALSLSPTPVYIATSRIWDEEFRQRVIKHQERRGPEWTNIEEEKENITNKAFNGKQIYKYMIPIEQAQINSNANLIISHNIEHLKIDKLLQLSGTIKTKVSKYWYTVPSNYNATPITLRLLDTQLQLIIPKEMSAEQFVEKGYITLLYTKNE